MLILKFEKMPCSVLCANMKVIFNFVIFHDFVFYVKYDQSISR